MPTGTISSSKDTVGVAVVNYEVPVVETKEQVLDNCRKIAQYVEGTKRGYPGLDLMIFPEYSTQGFHPTKWKDLTTTVPGPETEVRSRRRRGSPSPRVSPGSTPCASKTGRVLDLIRSCLKQSSW